MISIFPKFKKLELQDRKEIEEITKKYPPYSDFNFASLYSWNTDNDIEISLLYGNFIIKMNDYSEDKKLYSFLGNNEARKTTDVLRNRINKEKLCDIKLVPETNFVNDKKLLLEFEEDRDQFDYIYDLLALSTLLGPLYGKKRNLCKKFEKEYRTPTKIIELSNENIREQILELFEIWKSNKSGKAREYDHELIALKRCFELNGLITLGLYLDKKLIGFSINNILPNGYAYTVFEKTNNKYRGASEYFFKKKAEILCDKGCRLLNYAQDLGIPGLRKAKEYWKPVTFLKKYKISKGK